MLILSDCDGTIWCGTYQSRYDCCKGNEALIAELGDLIAAGAELWLWSGGGKQHAYNCALALGLPVREDQCFTKPDVAPMTREAAERTLGCLPDLVLDDFDDVAIPGVEFRLIEDYYPHGLRRKPSGIWVRADQ